MCVCVHAGLSVCCVHASISVLMCERKSKLSGMFRLSKKAVEVFLPWRSKPLFIISWSLFFGALVMPYASFLKCVTFVKENVQLDQFCVVRRRDWSFSFS